MKNNFITDIIDQDLAKKNVKIQTRFPPEPNGYLHIGHAKSIFLNFGIASKYQGTCNLRFDDTNPVKENVDYIASIIEDVKWLGIGQSLNILYASDYFEKMYEYAIQLITTGLAYVDDQTMEEIKNNRGNYNENGIESPFRDRSIEENLILFKNMKNRKYKDGEKVLRAKIDMNAQNINLRDPIMYRILHAHHHRTKNNWCIYPMYDWAHGLEDSIEGITHSICTLEFEDHRPLYDWFLEKLNIHHPKQIEFAKLNMAYTVISKRNLLKLIENKYVDGWDDPRMPTLSGLRRKGYTPESIKKFVFSLGIAKRESISYFNHLEHFVREDLNTKAQRAMAILNPLKIIITNYPNEKVEYLKAINNPENPANGKRGIPFSKEIYIEQSDFIENPPKKFFRLTLGKEVRLMHAYYIKCEKVIKDKNNKIIELHCTYDPKSYGGWTKDGRKVKGTLHWVSVVHALDAKINIYNELFNKENPMDAGGSDFTQYINPDSINIINNAKLEPSLKSAVEFNTYQFLRTGYFVCDKKSNKNNLVFNQIVNLRDSWSKKNK